MDVIVVGGSTGGLEALKRIASMLPNTFACPIIAVLHTREQSPRLLASIVGRNSALRVSYAEDGKQPCRGHVYIAPPGRHLVIRGNGALGLDDGPKVKHSRPAADRLFETAAEVYGSRVIGVVLSGGDGDGTDGLTAIKAHGGICIVQSPADSEAPSMPTNALLRGSPDHVALIEEMGDLLLSLVEQRVGRQVA